MIFLFTKLILIIMLSYQLIKLIHLISISKGMTFSVDFVSKFELSTVFALIVFAIFSRTVPNTEYFQIIINLAITLIVYLEFKRLILVGENEILLRGHLIKIDEIYGYVVEFVRLTVEVNGRRIHVLYPLATRSQLKKVFTNKRVIKGEII